MNNPRKDSIHCQNVNLKSFENMELIVSVYPISLHRVKIHEYYLSIKCLRVSVYLQKMLCLKFATLLSYFLCDITNTIWKVFFQKKRRSKSNRIVLTRVIITTINSDITWRNQVYLSVFEIRLALTLTTWLISDAYVFICIGYIVI